MKEFKVGDQVIVHNHHHGQLSRHRVKRVLKRFVELDDGSRWAHHGAPYPYAPGHWRPDLRHMTPELQAAVRRQNLLNKVRDWDPDKAGDACLRRVVAAIKEDT